MKTLDREIQYLRIILRAENATGAFIAREIAAPDKQKFLIARAVKTKIPEILMSYFSEGENLFPDKSAYEAINIRMNQFINKSRKLVARIAKIDIPEIRTEFDLAQYITSPELPPAGKYDMRVSQRKIELRISPYKKSMKIEINPKIWQRLKNPADKQLFTICLIRYLGTFKSELHQLAVPWREKLPHPAGGNRVIELFGSVFNHTARKFCSAFPDIERPFGSLGRFNSFIQEEIKSAPANSHYYYNPPYEHTIMLESAKYVRELLRRGTRISVHCVLPIWDGDGYTQMRTSHLSAENRRTIKIKKNNIEKTYGKKWEVLEILMGEFPPVWHRVFSRWDHPFYDFMSGKLINVVDCHSFLLANFDVPQNVIDAYHNMYSIAP